MGNEVPVEEMDNAEASLWGQARVHSEKREECGGGVGGK